MNKEQSMTMLTAHVVLCQDCIDAEMAGIAAPPSWLTDAVFDAVGFSSYGATFPMVGTAIALNIPMEAYHFQEVTRQGFTRKLIKALNEYHGTAAADEAEMFILTAVEGVGLNPTPQSVYRHYRGSRKAHKAA